MNNQRRHPPRNNDRGQKWNGLGQIKLAPDELSPDLFSKIAEDAAKHVNQTDKDRRGPPPPKQSQHRKFYDEICMWDNKCQSDSKNFGQYLPFILMLKAKVAYAKGRGHVNAQYESVINHGLGELEKKPELETLHNLKLFMEAFTGFYKVHGPRN